VAPCYRREIAQRQRPIDLRGKVLGAIALQAREIAFLERPREALRS
jgi:hypothetical protein